MKNSFGANSLSIRLVIVVVLLPALTLLAACGNDSDPAQSAPTTAMMPAAPAAFEPSEHEPLPNAKKLASDVVQAITNYDASPTPLQAVEKALGKLDATPGLATKAMPLIVPDRRSVGLITYPTLGGYKEGEASVMVLMRQQLNDAGGEVSDISRTVDVRLRLENGKWKPASIDSIGGDPVERPDELTDLQEDVLDNPSIELPDSARWDIYRNSVDPLVLDHLNRLSKTHRVSVAVMASGHPHNVFATEKTSNHTRGRAADVWALDGVPIANQRNDALKALVQRLMNEGVTEVGSPFDIDGAAVKSFTDIVHQDHLHIGFEVAHSPKP